MKTKEKPTRCAHKGCKTKHKSSTGYCAQHAHEGERHELLLPKTRTCTYPHLAEERVYADD